MKGLTDLMKEADKLFSLIVRLKASNDQGYAKCCTCNSVHHWKEMDCGHFMSRKHQSTRYDERNTGCQCKDCNIFSQGKQYEFAKYLDKVHGPGTADEMLLKSKMSCKRTRFDWLYLIEEFKTTLKYLKK